MEGVFYDEIDDGIVSNLTYEEGAKALHDQGVDDWDGLGTAEAQIDTSAAAEMGEIASEFNVTKKDKQSEDGNWDDW